MTDVWSKGDRKARVLINLTTDDTQITHVKKLQTAKATWKTLRESHKRHNLTSKLYLLRKLHSIKFVEDGNMLNLVTKIMEIVDKLSAIGEIIQNNYSNNLYIHLSTPTMFPPPII